MMANFAAHARDYDRYATIQQRVAARVISAMQPHYAAGQCWADAGCGTGALQRLSPATSFMQFDAALSMCVMAASLTDTPIICADVTALPMGDAVLDGYVSSMCWQWVDAMRAAAEMQRVCKPGASGVIALPLQQTFPELRASIAALTLPAALPALPSLAMMRSALDACGITITSEECWWERDMFPSARAFLSSVHRLGASGRSAPPLSVSQMRTLLDYYDTHYQQKDGTIHATYHLALWSVRL